MCKIFCPQIWPWRFFWQISCLNISKRMFFHWSLSSTQPTLLIVHKTFLKIVTKFNVYCKCITNIRMKFIWVEYITWLWALPPPCTNISHQSLPLAYIRLLNTICPCSQNTKKMAEYWDNDSKRIKKNNTNLSWQYLSPVCSQRWNLSMPSVTAGGSVKFLPAV